MECEVHIPFERSCVQFQLRGSFSPLHSPLGLAPDHLHLILPPDHLSLVLLHRFPDRMRLNRFPNLGVPGRPTFAEGLHRRGRNAPLLARW